MLSQYDDTPVRALVALALLLSLGAGAGAHLLHVSDVAGEWVVVSGAESAASGKGDAPPVPHHHADCLLCHAAGPAVFAAPGGVVATEAPATPRDVAPEEPIALSPATLSPRPRGPPLG